MKFFAIAALLATSSAITLHGKPPAAPVARSEATPNAAAGPVDKTAKGMKMHKQAIGDQATVAHMKTLSDTVAKKAAKSKNKPISTQPIPTPAGPSLPIHNKNKAGNGDTITALAQGPPGDYRNGKAAAWNCKCMGTTCVDHEGASCTTHQQPAHGGEKCQDGSRTSCKK